MQGMAGSDMFLIVKAGSTLPEVAVRRGDFEDWIAAGMGVPPERMVVVSVYRDEPLPEPDSFAGVVVTGSSAMVSEREDWSERTAAWLAKPIEAGTPLLGICYGHQLMAHGLGGRVGRNPRGREIGTVEVRFAGAGRNGDPLVSGLPEVARFQSTHVESVLELPTGAELLGGNDADPHHAFALGPRAWGVQFHPEFDADVMRGYLAGRRAILREEALDPEALEAATEETPAGTQLLRRFAELALGADRTT